MTSDALPPFIPGLALSEQFSIRQSSPCRQRAWLAIPSQRLHTVRAGRVFHDDLGLEAVRARLHWYPRDVWLYRMANRWRRIDQEEPWVGRCGDVGDELGSRIVATRLIVELMRLCFLLEGDYWPYFVGTMHNEIGVTEPVEPRLAPFFDRPYLVPHAMRFFDALLAAIESPTIRALTPYVGGIDQFADSTDILNELSMMHALTAVYDVSR